jgi:hypothetical protein
MSFNQNVFGIEESKPYEDGRMYHKSLCFLTKTLRQEHRTG